MRNAHLSSCHPYDAYKYSTVLSIESIIFFSIIMLYLTTTLLIFVATAPALISSLKCYECQVNFNYIVTEDNFSSFADCPIRDDHYRILAIDWDVTGNHTSISAYGTFVGPQTRIEFPYMLN